MTVWVSLAGRIVVANGGHRVDERELPGGQGRLVTALLLCERHRPVARDELAGNLWPAGPPRTWEAALRGVVKQARDFLTAARLGGPDVVRSTAGAYQVYLSADVRLDLEQAVGDVELATQALAAWDHAAARERAARARPVLAQPLLPGVESPWLEAKRAEMSRALVQALEVLAAARLELGDHEHAAAAAEEAIAVDPFRESAHRLVMRAEMAAGNNGAGLRAYDRCQRLLADELGADPAPETRRLHATLLRARRPSEPVARQPRADRTGDGGPGDVCPYRGLQTFSERDAAHFFGRSADVSRLLERLRDGGRLLAVVGPSGSGKSSLVRAGLVPAVRRGALPESDTWRVRTLRPGRAPPQALTAALDGATVGDTLLVVDQLEETFTLCGDERQRGDFLAALVDAAASPRRSVVVVVTLRADFYSKLAEYPRLADLASANQFLVAPMDEVGLAEAVQGPARVAGLTLEAGLTETILRDVARRPGSLPLLGHSLLELWRRRTDGVLTLAGYRQSGGVTGALAQRAEAVYLGLPPEQQAVARPVMLRLVTPGRDADDVRGRVPFSELPTAHDPPDAVDAVIAQFTEARLLSTGSNASAGSWVEVSHEALVRCWPRLRRWVDEDREGILVHRRLTSAAVEWQRLGRENEALYRGARLAEAAAWADRNPRGLNPLEREFLDVSRTVEQRQRLRRVHRLRLVAALLAAGLVAVATLAAVAVAERGRAEEQHRLALSRQLAAEAVGQLSIEPRRALSLAVEAVETARTSEAVAALRQALGVPTPRRELPGGPGDIALSPDGGQVAVAENGGDTVLVWDLQSGNQVQAFDDRAGVHGTAFSPDGSLLLIGGSDSARVWNVADGSLVHTLAYDVETHGNPAWSPDGSQVATPGPDSVRVWDADSGRLDATIQTSGPVAFVRWTSDGQAVLAWYPSDSGLQLFDVSTGRRLAVLEHENPLDAQVSPDGRYAVTVADDGNLAEDATARLWRLPEGEELAVLDGFSDWVRAGRFSPDGSLVIMGDRAGTVRLVETATGQPVFERRAHSDSVVDAAFGPDGDVAVTTSLDGTATVWDVATGQPRGVLRLGSVVSPDIGHRSVVFAPDGSSVLTLGATVHAWDVPAGPVTVLPAHRGRVTAAGFSPDGTLLATGADDGSVRVWDRATGEARWTTEVTDGVVRTASFSPDGSKLVTANPYYIVRADRRIPPVLWDTASGQRVRTLPVPAPARLPCPHVCQTTAAVFVPGSTTILTVGQEGVPRRWNPATGELLDSMEDAGRSLTTVASSPDGRWIAGLVGGAVLIWDAATGNLEHDLELDAYGNDLAFAPGGELLAVAVDDGTAGLWEVGTGRPVGELGPAVGVEGVAWSRDGRFLLTANVNGFHLWEVASQEHVLELPGTGSVAAFAPDNTMVTGRDDGTVHFHRCGVCGSVDELLDLAGERLSPVTAEAPGR